MVSAGRPLCSRGIEPGTADLDEIERKRTAEGEKKEYRRGGGGQLREIRG